MSAPGRIGICTDSAAQLPADLIERFGVEVVPITVSIDGEDYLEGIDLQVDDVTARGCAPRNGGDGGDGGEVRTSQPSPGQYALAYEQLLERGCTEILSLHGPAPDGPTSCSSARLAARQLDAPVRVVDTGAVGFALGCCVWAAGEAIARGASIDEAAAAAESLSGGRVGNLFVVDALGPQPGRRIQVLTGSPGDGARGARGARGAVDVVVEVVVEVDTVLEAVNEIAAAVVGWGHDLLVGIGHADDAAAPVADALASAVGETAAVREVVRYRVSASSAARTGAGTVTCFAFTGGVTPSSANVPSTPAAS